MADAQNPWSGMDTPPQPRDFSQVTYGVNQVQPLIAATDYGTNPFTAGINQMSAQATGDAGYATQQAQASQGTLAKMQDQFNGVKSIDSSYPTFSNSMGLGSQSGSSAPANPVPASSPGGGNPWTLQGEALSR